MCHPLESGVKKTSLETDSTLYKESFSVERRWRGIFYFTVPSRRRIFYYRRPGSVVDFFYAMKLLLPRFFPHAFWSGQRDWGWIKVAGFLTVLGRCLWTFLVFECRRRAWIPHKKDTKVVSFIHRRRPPNVKCSSWKKKPVAQLKLSLVFVWLTNIPNLKEFIVVKLFFPLASCEDWRYAWR